MINNQTNKCIQIKTKTKGQRKTKTAYTQTTPKMETSRSDKNWQEVKKA